MKIYIPHSSSFNYREELYAPVRSSKLNGQYEIFLPHEHGLSDTQSLIQDMDLIVAEVSYPSTGLGIELGWANATKKPIVAICRMGQAPSSSIKMIAPILEYSVYDLEKVLGEAIALGEAIRR